MKKSIVPVDVLSAAESNLAALARNSYVGRGMIVGLDDSGKFLVQMYWIMGRSENSRNRVFEREGGRLFTEAADPSKVKDPSLIIYNAMGEQSTGMAVVSNGHQTDAVMGVNSEDVLQILSDWQYEPDENFTPRITAVSYWWKDKANAEISLLRKSPFGDDCNRNLYKRNGIGKGFGYCITTYVGDGDPLPAFQGEPYLLPLGGDANFIAGTYWDALNADNRVSLAVKFIPKEGPSHIVINNKYKKGPFPTLA
ncbi:MAG: IMP cyclohydrolase [bacterium]|nr:IMP cyclohydrolase [bacterium]